MTDESNPNEPHHAGKIEVAVSTTSGFWPEDGFNELPVNQPIKVALEHAAHALELTNTTDWPVTVAGRAVDPARSYRENGLSKRVELDWGPSEGGGGHA